MASMILAHRVSTLLLVTAAACGGGDDEGQVQAIQGHGTSAPVASASVSGDPGGGGEGARGTGVVSGRVKYTGPAITAAPPSVTVDQSYCEGKVGVESPLVDQ